MDLSQNDRVRRYGSFISAEPAIRYHSVEMLHSTGDHIGRMTGQAYAINMAGLNAMTGTGKRRVVELHACVASTGGV